MQEKCFAQEHHGKTLARTCCVPKHPAIAAAVWLEPGCLTEQRLDAKGLLVAGNNLTHLAVKQNEIADEFQQPFWCQKADQQAVLIGYGLRC